MDTKTIDELARRIAASVPDSLRAMQDDLEQNFRAALQGGMERLDLVTREEFDVQAGVLRKTRERLRTLEARIAALEEAEGAGCGDAGG